MQFKYFKTAIITGAVAAITVSASPLSAGEKIANDASACRGDGPAIQVNITGVRSATGNMRVQTYRATKSDWLKSGRWLKRIEQPARQGSMSFCLPVDRPGTYAVAIRHDRNGNGKTDIFKDGGGMSNNPSISIWNLGKPSYKKVGVEVSGVTPINIRMRYM